MWSSFWRESRLSLPRIDRLGWQVPRRWSRACRARKEGAGFPTAPQRMRATAIALIAVLAGRMASPFTWVLLVVVVHLFNPRRLDGSVDDLPCLGCKQRQQWVFGPDQVPRLFAF